MLTLKGFLLIVLFLSTTESARKLCPTSHYEEQKESGRSFWTNKPIYKTFTVYTYIICKDVNITNQIKIDKNGNEAKGLKIIDMKNTKFPSGALDKLETLRELYLNDNKLESIESGAFQHLINLQQLYLQNNNVTEFNEETFSGLVSLLILDVSNNSLSRIDQNSFMSTFKLNYLNLSNNKLKNVHEKTFRPLKNLLKLDVSFNEITNIPANLFQDLNSLSQIFLNDNRIKIVPRGLFNYTSSLAIINLSNNNISIAFFNELKGFVDLYNNNIQNINSKIDRNVLGLNLSSNNLTMIPAKIFFYASHLLDLSLSNNNIKIINDDSFVGLKTLQSLNLDRNKLVNIPLGTFRELNKLNLLNLSTNFINYLEYGVFSGLKNLTTLDISHNRISVLELLVLYPLQKLKAINIAENQISSIDIIQIINSFKFLTDINLNKNNWFCDWLLNSINILKQKNINIVEGTSYKQTNILGIYCIRKMIINQNNTNVNNTKCITLSHNISMPTTKSMERITSTMKPFTNFISPMKPFTNSDSPIKLSTNFVSTIKPSTNFISTIKPTYTTVKPPLRLNESIINASNVNNTENHVLSTNKTINLPQTTKIAFNNSFKTSTISSIFNSSNEIKNTIINSDSSKNKVTTVNEVIAKSLSPELNEVIQRNDTKIDSIYWEMHRDEQKESIIHESNSLNTAMFIVILFIFVAVLLIIINQTHALVDKYKLKKEKKIEGEKYIKKDDRNIPVCWTEKN